MCERKDVYALGCVVVRILLLYSGKFGGVFNYILIVEFLLVGADKEIFLFKDDFYCMFVFVYGIRFVVEIVDKFCFYMNIDDFVKVK